jgi:Tol biopolymer transport system component
MALLAFAVSAPACGPSSRGKPSADKSSTILVATERASQGGRLVRVSSDGARQAALTSLPAGTTTLDRSPVYSADAEHLIFASNRERDNLAETSLWMVEAEGGQPRRLSQGPAVDRDPRVSQNGRWLYFCSNREGSFDLYRARLDTSKASLGKAERITSVAEQVLSPSLSPDDSQLVYMAVNEKGESSIWRVAADGSGEPVRLSEGPMDMTPAWSSDDTIAFSSRATNRSDADLFLMSADGSERRVLISAPNTDETGPRWSRDGRYLFAVGMYRSASDGKPLLGSVVYVDLREKKTTLRALHDPSAVESRIGLALAPVSFDAELLRNNPSYAEGLEQVLLQSAVRNESSRKSSGSP